MARYSLRSPLAVVLAAAAYCGVSQANGTGDRCPATSTHYLRYAARRACIMHHILPPRPRAELSHQLPLCRGCASPRLLPMNKPASPPTFPLACPYFLVYARAVRRVRAAPHKTHYMPPTLPPAHTSTHAHKHPRTRAHKYRTCNTIPESATDECSAGQLLALACAPPKPHELKPH